LYFFFFFFNDTATTEIYTLSLHDALPILKATFEALKLLRTADQYKSLRGTGEGAEGDAA